MTSRWTAITCLTLAACSGGSSGNAFTFSPSTVQVSAYAGESPTFTVLATASHPVNEYLTLLVVDSAGVLAGVESLDVLSDTQFNATFRVSGALTVGRHAGKLEILLCRDGSACQDRYATLHLPYEITVASSTNLTPLHPLAGAADWTTYQGDASHTGYVPATVDPAAFSRRFRSPRGGVGVAAVGGAVFAVTGTESGAWTLTATSEATGTELWSAPMGTLSHVNAPAAAGGKVYVTSTGHGDTAFWIFDAATGEQLVRTAMNSQWEDYLAPTVFDGGVYTDSGYYGGLSRFDAETGELSWFVPLPQFDAWTPGVDANGVYAHAGGQLSVLEPATGETLHTVVDPHFDWSGYSMFGASVLDGQGNVFVTQYGSNGAGRLIKFDAAAGALTWDLTASIRSNPVLAAGVLYVLDGNALEARSPETGAVLWSWPAPEGIGAAWWGARALVVVGHHAFFQTSDRTRAVDLVTHQPVWSDGATGALAVSANGVLYIQSANGLVAVNLH